ncbi:MAG: response regulator [Deltaproteobacteria bacterium]|nr:response regulator [Deltaproteobacteria bacterium]
MPHQMGDFQINERMMRYSAFIPRFYNLCRSYGFEPGRIMPSRAFCSDENQGYPIILITKHFGAFPFNHGRVGGIVATDRHGAYAHHGKDLVIIQASHVGYDPETNRFGAYRRLKIDKQYFSTSCGKICGVLDWYFQEYAFAQENILFSRIANQEVVVIDNQLLDPGRQTGLFLHLERITMKTEGKYKPLRSFSTSKAFRLHPAFRLQLPDSVWQPERRVPIGKLLTADLFYFRHSIPSTPEGQEHLEYNLSHSMPRIVTSTFPALAAAKANTQIEFDRTYRTIIKEQGYQGKNLAFIAGINIDISPLEGQLFPLTKFVPWAAYIQTREGRQVILEQDELVDALHSQSTENDFQIDIENEIRVMTETPSKVLLVDDEREFVQTLSERLRIRDVDAVIAYDGESALHLIKEDEPDVMILDLKMPEIDGIEVLQRVKKTNPNMEVIILTGHGGEADHETCMEMGAFAYLQKPLNIDEFSEVLQQAKEKVHRAK